MNRLFYRLSAVWRSLQKGGSRCETDVVILGQDQPIRGYPQDPVRHSGHLPEGSGLFYPCLHEGMGQYFHMQGTDGKGERCGSLYGEDRQKTIRPL